MTAASKKKRNSQDPAGETRVDLRPVQVSLLAVYALIAVSAFLPRVQLWGINHLAFYPLPVRLAALIFIGAAFLPPVAGRLYSSLLKLSNVIKQGGGKVDLTLTVLAALSILLFGGLRTATNLLGDGQLIAQSFEASWEGNETVIMRSVEAIVTEEKIAPGATLYYYGTAKLLSRLFDRSPVDGIRYFNCFLGAVFLFIFSRVLRRGPFSPELRLWLLVLVLFSSSMQLFFGYIENYTPMVFAAFLYVLSSFLILHSRSRLWVPVLLFAVSFYTHIQSLLFAPSLLYLVLWRLAKGRRALVEKYAAPGLVLLTVAGAIVVGAFTRFEKFYLPLLADSESYGLLSPAHIADVFNEILMLSPLLPMFAVLAWITRSPSGKKKAASTAWFTLTCEWQFTCLVLVPCLIYLLLFKPEIGMARDWDLFAMTSLGFIPLALLILNRLYRGVKNVGTPEAALFAGPAVAITVVLGVAWIGLNASSARTATRSERILEYDRTHASYAYENLAIFYYDNKDLPKATEMMETAVDISRNPRQYVRLGMYYDELGRTDEAIQMMRDVLKPRPDFAKARFYLLTLLEKTKAYAELVEVARDGTRYNPEEAVYWFYLGEMSIMLGNIEEGLTAYRKCLTLNPPEVAAARAREQIQKHSPTGQ